jgi:hypothetical protein
MIRFVPIRRKRGRPPTATQPNRPAPGLKGRAGKDQGNALGIRTIYEKRTCKGALGTFSRGAAISHPVDPVDPVEKSCFDRMDRIDGINSEKNRTSTFAPGLKGRAVKAQGNALVVLHISAQKVAYRFTAKRFNSEAQGRPELARGAPWDVSKDHKVTPKVLNLRV